MRDAARTVGGNLRRLRLARGLSLVELGRLSGLAKGTLTQLEAGRANPTIETLQALARALGAGLPDLVADPPPSGIEVVRDGEGSTVAAPSVRGRFVHRAALGTMVVETMTIHLTAGLEHHGPAHAPGVVQQVYVLEGVVEIGPLGDVATLHPHDFARFPADQPHVCRAPDGDVELLSWFFIPAVPKRSTTLSGEAAESEVVGTFAVRPSEPVLPPRVLPQPPVRGRRPPSRTVPGPRPNHPRPPGPGR